MSHDINKQPSHYSFSEYCSQWVDDFQTTGDLWKELLGQCCMQVHHIGSTSVPGLAAKPIIDVLPVVDDVQSIDQLQPKIESADYRAWGEYGIVGRRFFTKDRGGVRIHNVHCFAVGSAEVERHVAFAAYLREHDSVRNEYEQLKRKCYQQHPNDIGAYNAGKDAFIKVTEKQAISWFRKQ